MCQCSDLHVPLLLGRNCQTGHTDRLATPLLYATLHHAKQRNLLQAAGWLGYWDSLTLALLRAFRHVVCEMR